MPRTPESPDRTTRRVALSGLYVLSLLFLLSLTVGGLTACSGSDGPDVAPTDTSGGGGGDGGGLDGAGGGDAAADASGGGDGGGSCESGAPPGHATIRFAVDDRARRTFDGGEMVWTGSFSLDEATNVITFSSSWLPEEGPFPHLYDDGPRAECGHEQPDAVAGDHLFTTEIYYAPVDDTETTLEYGLLNEWNNWMWVGPNGTVTIPVGSTDVFVADGMVIPPCGDADLKVTLDTAALGGGFEGTVTTDPDGTPSHDVYIKGTMNMWTNVRLVDNGKRGDAAADDGVYTFVLSENLGKHDCTLLAGDHPQFVFTFAAAEQPPETGLEYKDDDSAAIAAGVAAQVDPSGTGGWQDADVFMEVASDGVRMNTTVAIPGEAPTCESDADCGAAAYCIVGYCVPCYEDDHCPDGACVKNRCTDDGPQPDCAADEDCPEGVCVGGACVACRDASTCPAGWTCEANRCVEPSAPDCDGDGDCDGGYCVEGRCVECRSDEDCQTDERCRAGNCVLGGGGGDGPVLYQLTPATGPTTGGTEVTLKGLQFVEGMTVHFGDAAATDVVVTSDQLATCTTPAGTSGRVDVVVRDPDGGSDTFFGGFYYYEASEGPQVSSVQPDRGPTTGGSPVSIHGANFAEGVQVRFGGSIASAVRRIDAGLLQATAPSGAEGTVDVTVTNPDGLSATCAGCYTFVELQLGGTPTVDGAIGADWPANHVVAENDVPSSWGDGNVLETLYVAFDETHLYVGIAGSVEDGNAIVAYVDTDGDPATGIDGAAGCWDDGTWGDVDDALCVTQDEQGAGEGAGSLWFGNAAFGAEVAFATQGMTSYDDPACEDLGGSLNAGWRRVGGIADGGDLAWLCGSVVTGAGVVEARIALDALYPDGVPAGGSDVGLLVRIVSGEGNFLSNQSLPSLLGSSNIYVVTGVVRFRID